MNFSKKIIVLLAVSLSSTHVSITQEQANEDPEITYHPVNWNTENGLIWGRLNTMLKDKEGFLWITSEFGLNRFDGSRFIGYYPDKNRKGTIGGTPGIGLIEDSLNNIWIGTRNGLSRYDLKADSFTNFRPDLVDQGAIIPFWASKDEIYCVETFSSITSYNIHTTKKRTHTKLQIPGLLSRRFAMRYSVLDSVSNSIWMLPPSEDGILQVSLSSGQVTHHKRYVYKKVPDLYKQFNNETMCYDKKRNCIWINSHDGLIQFTLDKMQFHYTYKLVASLNRKEYDRWSGIDIDANGRVWLATLSNGFVVYDPASQLVTLPLSGSSLHKEVSDGNFAIYHDRDGITWISSWLKKGIYQLVPSRHSVTRYDSDELQPNQRFGFIPGIVPADHGKLWIGSPDGLLILDANSGSAQSLKEKDMPGIRGKWIQTMIIDTIIQKAWLSAFTPNDPQAPDAIYEMNIATKKCRPVVFKDTARLIIKPKNIVPYSAKAYKNSFIFLDAGNGIFEMDRDSAIARQILAFSNNPWIFLSGNDELVIKGLGTYSNVSGRWESSPSPLDTMDWIVLLHEKADDDWWVGGTRQLMHLDKQFRLIKRYTEKDGLPGREISYILSDNYNNIWFANTEGIISRLNPKTGHIITLSERDGFKKQFFQWQATFKKDSDGNLYFAGEEGIDRIEPDKMNTYPPSVVYLKSLRVNQNEFPTQTAINDLQSLVLKYFQNTINIETGVIDYFSNGQSRIRYKLEGVDEDWEYAPAYYTISLRALSPRKYRLVLQASNASGEFNGPEKTLHISISPPFWKTNWFRISAVAFLLLVLYLIYRWRTATLRKQKRLLEQTVKERTAEVVAEKKEVEKQKAKSDDLLLNILPAEVADELKEKGYTTAKSFEEVTILFSDIKGFTHVAEKLTAQELVKEINIYFSAFDSIILKYGLEKIKTIGDAYIAGGGLPEKNSANAENVIEAAIEMQKAVEKLKQERVMFNKSYFELRIGIHTGPVVAGVVGIKKFQYDIWGDTVNLAARMEQSGVPGRINISEITFKKVRDKFNCVYRGKIEAKNKGEMDMYFVESKNN